MMIKCKSFPAPLNKQQTLRAKLWWFIVRMVAAEVTCLRPDNIWFTTLPISNIFQGEYWPVENFKEMYFILKCRMVLQNDKYP